jgi:transcriptional regulator with XRE-family HTH domain
MTTPTVEQRRVLGIFLRAHRERLGPEEVRFLGGSGRRRTPGLRREEVAHLSGVSPTWYTWLEQGRDVSVSAEALARIAEALHLTTPERAYLFELARKRDPELDLLPVREPDGERLVTALDAMACPAYVLDPNWNACGANVAARRLFASWLDRGAEPNLLRYVFLDAAAQQLICEWEHRARRLVAEFRADTAGRADDPAVARLVRELSAASSLFADFWKDQRVLAREGGMRDFNHPQDGLVRYEQITLLPAARSGYKLVMLVSERGG